MNVAEMNVTPGIHGVVSGLQDNVIFLANRSEGLPPVEDWMLGLIDQSAALVDLVTQLAEEAAGMEAVNSSGVMHDQLFWALAKVSEAVSCVARAVENNGTATLPSGDRPQTA